MKKSLILFLIIFVFTGCAGQKKGTESSLKIEYKAHSRGFYQMILIESQVVYVTKRRQDKPNVFQLSAADWNSLKTTVLKLDLESLPNIKAPTEKRFFDGAAIASLKIIQGGKVYESQSFDHGFPPTEIKKLVDKINTFTKTQ